MPVHSLTYARRRNQGLCWNCGRPLEDKNFVKCQSCREKNAQSVRKHKSSPEARERERKWLREYHRNHPEKNQGGVNLRQKIIALLGGRCVTCGFTDIRALQIDHVNGGGMKEYSRFKNSWDYLKYVRDNILSGRYQVLCANCNWIKRSEKKENR